MLLLLRYALLQCAIIISIRGAYDYRKLFIRNAMDASAIFSCASHTAKRLFNDGNRIGVICYQCDHFENRIISMFMKEQPIVVSSYPLSIKKRRAVSYVVFATPLFVESRRGLLKNGTNLHRVQYLFVNTAEGETVLSFANELWSAGFRDIAFLTLNSSNSGTVQVPVMKQVIALKYIGYCSPSASDLKEITPYSSNFYRFCAKIPCTLLHGAVTDDTVKFWREEDKLKISETDDYEPMGIMLIERFTSFFGIEPHYKQNNLTWPQAAEKLISGELDMVVGLMPKNLDVLEGLEVICWYRDRTLRFSAQVRRRLRDTPVLQLLTPFHYSVWICTIVMLLLYVLLLCALRIFANMGLIRERLYFIQIYEIMLSQGTVFPKKTSLRAILALWMLFSLNLSIVYNSTFTSSLADLDVEDLLKDLRELRDSGMSLCGPPIVRNFLNDSSDPVIVDLNNRYTVMRQAEKAFDAIMSNNTMGVIQHMTVNRINWATRTDRNLRIYTLSQPVLTFPVLFYTRAEHPYRVPFERIVTEYRESGLLYKWVKYYVIDEDKQIATSHQDDDDDGGILTMEHLGPVFQFFFMCQAISILLFLIELFQYRLLSRTQLPLTTR